MDNFISSVSFDRPLKQKKKSFVKKFHSIAQELYAKNVNYFIK